MGRKQSEIPGTERKTIKEVDDAAEAYREARDARIKKSKAEKEKKDALVAVMRKHGVNVYRDDAASPPLIVTLTENFNVKVTNVEGDEDFNAEE